MAKRVSEIQAKEHLSALSEELASGGQRVVIERRGMPLAALVSIADLEKLDHGRATSAQPRGALALVGAWREVDDGELEALVEDIYGSR